MEKETNFVHSSGLSLALFIGNEINSHSRKVVNDDIRNMLPPQITISNSHLDEQFMIWLLKNQLHLIITISSETDGLEIEKNNKENTMLRK